MFEEEEEEEVKAADPYALPAETIEVEGVTLYLRPEVQRIPGNRPKAGLYVPKEELEKEPEGTVIVGSKSSKD